MEVRGKFSSVGGDSYQRVSPFAPSYVLALESSCDETSVAVLYEGRDIKCNLISSQVELHRKYGGVVPEVACRRHSEVMNFLLEEAILRAGISWGQIEAVAVTHGPGLIGAVLIGVAAAKALSFALECPLIGVNHLEGHLYSIFLEWPDLVPPVLYLLVSGGHTLLVLMREVGVYKVLGGTRDDAAGEAFDKVAKLLGLGYPGGPLIDNMARRGNPAAVCFPRPMLGRGWEFSFSGLKTAVRNFCAGEAAGISPEDICASFQEAVVDVLVDKTVGAAVSFEVENIAVVGGVACNSRLRCRMAEEARRVGCRVVTPSPSLCTDNAAMIARAGWELARMGVVASPFLDAFPNLPLLERRVPT